MRTFRDQEDWAIGRLENQINSFLNNDIDSTYLAHYCSIVSATSIIQSGISFFSPADTMNDHREFHFIYDKILSNLQLQFTRGPHRNNQNIIKVITHLHRSKIFQMNNSFVFCLSEIESPKKSDNLSMWRAYASDGEGCALIFKTDKLLSDDIKGQFPIYAWKVRYFSEEEAEEEARNFAETIIEALSQINNTEFEDNIEGIQSFLSSKLTDLCFACKHSGFSEEKEVRLVYRFEYDLDPHTFTATTKILGGDVNVRLPVELKPYSEFNIDLSISNILDSVMVGPSPNQSKYMKSLYLALKHARFICNKDNLIPSTTPYRPIRR